MIVGESGAGKTSLVKSLTGKPFDLEEPKTKGIDRSLVNETWQNLKLKDLISEKLRQFFTTVFVQLYVFGKAGNVIVQESTDLPSNVPKQVFLVFVLLVFGFLYCLFGDLYQPAPFLLLCIFMALIIVAAWFIFHSESIRLVAIACNFIADYPGFLMGALLSILSEFYFTGMSAAISFSSFVLLVVLFIFLYKVSGSFQKSFGIDRKCWYPGQLKFENQRRVQTIFIAGFVTTVIIGYTCLTILMIFNLNETNDLTVAVVMYCELSLFLQLVHRKPDWRHIVITCFANVCFHLVKNLRPLDLYCIIAYFLIICCVTAYKEYLCITSVSNYHEGTSNFTAYCVEKAAMNQRNSRNALNEKFSSLKLKIVEFARDKEYYAYHHMFLRSRAIYVIVFNMAEFAGNNVRDIHARIKTLHLWFESVRSLVPTKTPILLVGTHSGNMNKIWMEEINGHLKRGLWHQHCDEIIENDVDKLIFFPVENSQGQNDSGVQTLQKKIMTVAAEYKGTTAHDIHVPLSWIQIQDEIISLRENEKAKFCVTLQEFPTAFGSFICTDWSQNTLKYFHEKGLVIYLDQGPGLSKWVLLKPEILVDIIIQLATPPPQEIQKRGFRNDWKLLHDKGMLTKSLLSGIISTVQENEEAMTAILEEYDLICPLSNRKGQMCNQDDDQNQPTYFVPSLLPMSTDGCMTPVWHDNNTDKKFYVFFERLLPEPLFHHLQSRAHRLSMIVCPNSQPVLYRDAGMFWMWGSQGKQPYRLRLLKEEGMIEVTISSRYCCKQVSDIREMNIQNSNKHARYLKLFTASLFFNTCDRKKKWAKQARA